MHFKVIRGPNPRLIFDEMWPKYFPGRKVRQKVERDDEKFRITNYFVGSRIEGRAVEYKGFFTEYEIRSNKPDTGQW
jgi:hypothetical protein